MDDRLIKYFQGELSPTERLQFLRQVEADDELKQQFIEYKNMQAMLHLSSQPCNNEENRQAYTLFNRIIRAKKIRRFMLQASSYAAAILLVVMSTYWITTRYHNAQQAFANIQNTLYVPAGQRVQLTLQDGTEVWLNAQTKFTYPAVFAGNERRVQVEGEAFFSVAKNPQQPFIVSSQGVEMKVLGTKFNVTSYPGENAIHTSLLEGGLKVYFHNAESDGIILKPNQQVTIKGKQMEVTPLPHTDYFLWRNGIYSFVNEPLIDILKKLELYYDVKIVVEDPSIYTWDYTGKFRQRDGIDEILRMLQHIHKFSITKDEENNIYTLK
ncbi:MAG: FecR family protein [Muribaculaceae bacterium]